MKCITLLILVAVVGLIEGITVPVHNEIDGNIDRMIKTPPTTPKVQRQFRFPTEEELKARGKAFVPDEVRHGNVYESPEESSQ